VPGVVEPAGALSVSFERTPPCGPNTDVDLVVRNHTDYATAVMEQVAAVGGKVLAAGRASVVEGPELPNQRTSSLSSRTRRR